jgi:hypothetical protein
MPIAINMPILLSARLTERYGCVYDVLKIIVLSFDVFFVDEREYIGPKN